MARSRELGLSTNVWTVNKAPIARDMLELGVEAVTTDEPLLLRNLLKRRENKR